MRIFPWLFGIVLAAAHARATEESPPAEPSVIPPTKPSEEAPTIVPPRALATPLEYPTGGRGAATVLLELVIDATGKVTDVRVLQGATPFTTAAEHAVQSWSFVPATRDGKPVAARIRFEATFVPQEKTAPHDEGLEPTTDADAPESPTGLPIEPAPAPRETEILIVGDRPASAHTRSRAEVRQLPGAFGDPFRAIESLPGVVPIVSGLPYFYVRGSPPGNIGFFLDDVRIPVLFHIGAGPAVVHPAFIDTVELYPGPYPARYGRFVGGIVAGHTAEPSYETRAEASVRLVDAGAMLETHALDRKLSVMLGGRYSYTAAIISLLAPELDVSYWDYQGRVQYRPSARETITLFGFGSLDNATETRSGGRQVTIFDLVFHRASARYRRDLADGGFWELRALAGLELTAGDEGFMRLQDEMLGAGARLERPLSDTLRLRGGVDVQADRYGWRARDEDFFLDTRLSGRTDVVTGVQVDLPWQPERGVRATPGARLDLYFSGETTPWWGVAPGVLAEFDVAERFTLLHGFGVAQQLPSFVVPLPGIQPQAIHGLQHALQHSAGVRTRLGAGLQATATVFQNVQLNLTDALSAVNTSGDVELDADQRGQGSGRGLELLLEKSLSSRLGGYLSYTLSQTRRSYGRFRGYSSFDRRHVLGGAIGYQAGKGWILGARGTFYTGIPGRVVEVEDTYALGQEPTEPNPVRSVPRTQPFWRLDWRVEKRWPIGNEGAWWALVAEVLNTTLNKEMISRTCNPVECRTEVIGPVTIPSLGVEASF